MVEWGALYRGGSSLFFGGRADLCCSLIVSGGGGPRLAGGAGLSVDVFAKMRKNVFLPSEGGKQCFWKGSGMRLRAGSGLAALVSGLVCVTRNRPFRV